MNLGRYSQKKTFLVALLGFVQFRQNRFHSPQKILQILLWASDQPRKNTGGARWRDGVEGTRLTEMSMSSNFRDKMAFSTAFLGSTIMYSEIRSLHVNLIY